MGDDDVGYLVNYKPETLYVHPVSRGTGAYTTLLADGEELVGEIDVTSRFKRKRRCDPIDSSGSEGFSDVRFFRGTAMSLEGSEDE